jgi:hypothetical protein
LSYEVWDRAKIEYVRQCMQPLRDKMDRVFEELQAVRIEPELSRIDGKGDDYSHERSRPRHHRAHDPVKRDKRKRMARVSRQKNRR